MCEAVVCYAGSVHDTELYWCSGFKLTKGLDECWRGEGICWTGCVCVLGGGGLHACMCVSCFFAVLRGRFCGNKKHVLTRAFLTHTSNLATTTLK